MGHLQSAIASWAGERVREPAVGEDEGLGEGLGKGLGEGLGEGLGVVVGPSATAAAAAPPSCSTDTPCACVCVCARVRAAATPMATDANGNKIVGHEAISTALQSTTIQPSDVMTASQFGGECGFESNVCPLA